jgi:hypothetical protein
MRCLTFMLLCINLDSTIRDLGSNICFDDNFYYVISSLRRLEGGLSL